MSGKDSQYPIAGRGALAAWVVLFVMIGLGVLCARLGGVGVLDRLSAHNPDRAMRVARAGLGLTHEMLKRPGAEPNLRQAILAGAGSGAAVRMAAHSEDRGKPARAHLWLALDAKSRSMPPLIAWHEKRALALSGAPAAQETLDRLLPEYRTWKDWASVPTQRAMNLILFAERSRLAPLAEQGLPTPAKE